MCAPLFYIRHANWETLRGGTERCYDLDPVFSWQRPISGTSSSAILSRRILYSITNIYVIALLSSILYYQKSQSSVFYFHVWFVFSQKTILFSKFWIFSVFLCFFSVFETAAKGISIISIFSKSGFTPNRRHLNMK